MLTNPYAPRSTPSILAGRDREILIFQQVLARVQATRRAAEGGVVLYGIRGIGKTSILRVEEDLAGQQGFVTAWISAAKGQPLLPSLLPTVRTALENHDVVKRGKWTIKSIGLEIGVGPLKASAKAERDDDAGIDWNVGTVERLLREAARLCAEKGNGNGAGLVLFIDELHAVSDKDLAILSNALQNISHDRRFSPPFALFAAGLPSIRGLATKAATFGERTEFIPIKDIAISATKKALREPANRLGVKFDDDALQVLADASNGYPYFVQLYGFHTWRATRPEPGTIITLADAKKGILQTAEDVQNLFVARLTSATTTERSFIEALARLGGDNAVKRADLAAELGKNTRGISGLRARLIDKAVISEEERGYLQFTLPGFAEYVLEELD